MVDSVKKLAIMERHMKGRLRMDQIRFQPDLSIRHINALTGKINSYRIIRVPFMHRNM